jgi:hypothetical protein
MKLWLLRSIENPFAFPDNKSGGNCGSKNEVRSGQRVIYTIDGRHAMLDECLQDGDAFVTWNDGTFGTVKWSHLIPAEPK